MSDDIVNFEVDGKAVQGRKGQMIMQVTDTIDDAYIPRFCYHEKLTVAANCRMCLVEVEKAPKPLPACATPIGEGMKVFTKSPRAIAAQRATMEFLLINHPLDCPICDQGGECELQDLAMGFGRDISRFNDRKRIVKDQNIGPLVSTDMTRCIHCTRCVRFGAEISGIPELGAVRRGEDMRISTYVEKSIDHELSANIIDLCPVGALNDKPYRYSARAWEMMQRPLISPHDCVGSNMFAHVLRGTIKRVVPRENEQINETWLADRDRFGFRGIYSDDRLTKPRIKENGAWRDVDWEDALLHLAERLKAADGEKIGILASPSATLEEHRLLVRIAEARGSANIDHRLRRRDFGDQDNDPLIPWLGSEIAGVEAMDALLIVGSDLRKEAPIVAHRVRKAALRGARVAFVNERVYDYFFDVADYLSGASLVDALAGIAVAAASGKTLPPAVEKLCQGVEADDSHRRIAGRLAETNKGHILVGEMAQRRPDFSVVRALAAAVATLTGVRFGYLSEGSNTAGAHLAGALPHRTIGGQARDKGGRDAGAMLESPLDAILLFGIEPDKDLADRQAVGKLAAQPFVAALTPYASDALAEAADLLLPIGTFAETAGTYVNCEGRWQSFAGAATPVGEARPGWKVLRVLGNLMGVEGFEYQTSEGVRDEFRAALGAVEPDNGYAGKEALDRPADGTTDADFELPMYEVDPVVRRSAPLQLTPEALRAGKGSAT